MLEQIIITSAITLLISFLLETFTGWAVSLGLGVAATILDPSTFSFVLDNGASGGLLNILPAISGVGILNIFKAIGWTLLVINCLLGVMSAIFSPAMGEKAVSPQETLFSGIFTAIVMVATFGIGQVRGLIYKFGEIMDNFMQFATRGMLGEDGKLTMTINALKNDVKTAIEAGTDGVRVFDAFDGLISGDFNGNGIFMLIAAVTICTGCISAAIIHIERYFSLALYIVVGPTAISFNSSQATRETAKQWFIGLLTQSLAIILSILCWRMFFVQITKPWTVFNVVTSVVILTMIRKSEQIFNMIGLKTMPNADAARSFIGATATAVTGITTISRLASSGASSLYGAIKDKKISDNKDKIADAEFFRGMQNAKSNSDVQEAANKWKNSHSHGLFRFNNDAMAAKKYEELKEVNKNSLDHATSKAQDEYKNSLLSARKYDDFKKAVSVRDNIPVDKISFNTDSEKVKNSPVQTEEALKPSEINSSVNDNSSSENRNVESATLVFNPNAKYADEVLFSDETAKAKNNIYEKDALSDIGENTLHNFNAAYFNDRVAAYGDKVATGNINSNYEKLGQEIFGTSYRLPQVATCSTDKTAYIDSKTGSEFSMSIEKSDPSNTELSTYVQNVNDVMSENSTRETVAAGTAMEAFGLNNYNLTDSGMVAGELSNKEDYIGYSGISLLQDEQGNQQLYTFMPADYAIPEGTTISPTIETMSSASYELEPSKAVIIGDNVAAVPLKDATENLNNSNKDENMNVIHAQTVLYDTFTQLAANPVSNRFSGDGSQYRRNGKLKEEIKENNGYNK